MNIRSALRVLIFTVLGPRDPQSMLESLHVSCCYRFYYISDKDVFIPLIDYTTTHYFRIVVKQTILRAKVADSKSFRTPDVDYLTIITSPRLVSITYREDSQFFYHSKESKLFLLFIFDKNICFSSYSMFYFGCFG